MKNNVNTYNHSIILCIRLRIDFFKKVDFKLSIAILRPFQLKKFFEQNCCCNSIAVDNSENVYCAGYTYGALGEAHGGGRDLFVMKLIPL